MKNGLEKKCAETLSRIRLPREIRIMEVCGTHTTEFFRTGVKGLFPPGLSLIDGPGCPVCVTSNEYLDRAIAIGRTYGVAIVTFGDMMKVPSSGKSLAQEKAEGLDVRIAYSPADAIEMAASDPGREYMFLSVGFETTAPAEAASLIDTQRRGIRNFSILPGNKRTPPAVEAILRAGETRIDGFILPGHVSAIIGAAPWRFIAQRFGKPCVIAGFEPLDLMMATIRLVELILEGKAETENLYGRVVKENGNPVAREVMERVFETADSNWRGIGSIPASGLVPRREFSSYDAAVRFPVSPPPPVEAEGCRCGEILRGVALPPDCPLFGSACTPEEPVGPCMVSMEGPCSAYYKYGVG